jgi:hypothetical protein
MTDHLPEDPLISQVFEFIDLSAGAVQVMPVTVAQAPDDTRLALFIRGEHDTASIIFAKLMGEIQDLFDMQQQADADDNQTIVTP